MDTNRRMALFEAFLVWLMPQQGASRDAMVNDVAVALSVASGELMVTLKVFGHDMTLVNYWAGYEAAVRASAAARNAGFEEVAQEFEEMAKLFNESIAWWNVQGVQ